MNKLIFIALLAGGYYFYSTNETHYSISDVANNPVPANDYVQLWEHKAIELCELNAKDYNIDIKKCPTYISQKFPQCRTKLPSNLPDVIDSKELGKQVIGRYFQCISAWPHCNGREITTESDLRKYCKNT